MLTTKRMQIIDRKDFAAAALNLDEEAVVVHVASLTSKMLIHPAQEAQIASLLTEVASVSTNTQNLPISFHQIPRRNYRGTPASTITLSTW